MIIDIIIKCIIFAIVFSFSFLFWNKLLDRADTWVTKTYGEDAYGKFSLIVIVSMIVILITYGFCLLAQI